MAEYNPSKIIKDGNTYNFRDTTKIPLAGSNEISGSLIPNTDGTVNLGSPSYQWNNAYIKSLTINGVVCGDILTHNVSEFVNVTGAQTIGGVKTFSSNVIIQGSKKVTCNLDNSFIELDGGTTWGKGGSIVLSGQDRSSYTNSVLIVSKSDTNTDILQYQNGELKPLSNNTNNSSLGTPTNKWSKVYSDDVVHTTDNETIGGIKKFSDIPIVANGKTFVSQINASRANGTQTGFSAYNGFKIVCNNDSQAWDNTAFAIHMPEYSPTRAIVSFKLFDCIEGSSSYKGFLFRKNNNNCQLFPAPSNAIGLGTSTNKWKSFNGVNPGALSLPGNYVNVDTTNWVLDGTPNHFVPTSDGWLGIQATDTVYDQMHYIFVGRTGGGSTYYQQNLASPINALWDSKYHGSVFIPVVKNFNYDIRCICNSIVATFYPCQGNV